MSGDRRATEGFSFAARSGLSGNGLPYNLIGKGPRLLVLFQGLTLQNAPMSDMEARYTRSLYSSLIEDHTILVLGRRQGLPDGCTIADMANDCAEMIEHEIARPVDVIGLSTGGSICQQFALDHPHLLRRLVIHSSAHTLGPLGKSAQLRVRDLAREGRWRECGAILMEMVVPPAWYRGAIVGMGSLMMAIGTPQSPSDLIVTIDAEDRFDCRERLGEVRAPTLLIAGERDPFYTPELFRATAEGIPGCRLVLYQGMGHPAKGQQFQSDLSAFLCV
jgi:pimeloyl-ACP methyl ester carboxylesterase